MAETASNQEIVDFPDMPVGEILRRTRLHYNQSINDIERALRIRASQIEAIEQGTLENLPGKVYAIGFVRAYAEFLGLDGDKIVHLFKVQMSDQSPEPELQFPLPASDSKIVPLWLTFLSLVTALVVLAFWMNAHNQERAAVADIPPVPEKMQMAAESTLQSTAPAAEVVGPPQNFASPTGEEPVIAEKPQEGIILNIRENSWVEIRDQKGRAMLSRVLKAGDQYYVPDRPDLTISIGNAAGVEIEVDGIKLKALGEKGQVLRRLPLDVAYLKSNYAVEN